MANGSERKIVYSIEDSPGELNSPNLCKTLRTVTGSGISNDRTAITSNEIRDDRQIIFSKLGNTAPALTVPFEFSYDSYDDLIACAMGNVWTGGMTATINMDMSTGGVITRNDGGSWLVDGYTVGTFVTIEGLVVTAEDGSYEVTVVTANDLTVQEIPAAGAATFTAEVGGDITFTAGAYGEKIITSVSDTVTVVASTKTITLAGTLTWDVNIEVGDRLYFNDFVNAGNNGWKEVTGRSGLALTFANDTLVDEVINSASSLTFSTAAGIITVGTDLKTLFIEEQFTDATEFVYIQGAKVDSFNLSMQPEAILTGDFGIQGQKYSGYSGATSSDSVEASNINTAFDSFTGFMDLGGIATCVVSGFDFSLANGLSRDYALLEQDACRIGEGRSTTTASLSGFFIDSTVVDLYDNETYFKGVLNFQDVDGNGYTFVFPRIKLNSHSLDIPENSITFSAGADILGGSTDGLTNVAIHRIPVIS